MGKSIRSKRMQKWKGLKRMIVRETLEKDNLASLGKTHYIPKNAFLHPKDSDAVFPQRKPTVRLDFRSDAITPFECPVKSQKYLIERMPDLPEVEIKGRPIEIPDIFMGELEYSLKNIERNTKKKQAMKIDN